MKKKVTAVMFVMVMALQLVACSFEPTCKESDCEETDIYEAGYCKYHYYINAGEYILKDIIN